MDTRRHTETHARTCTRNGHSNLIHLQEFKAAEQKWKHFVPLGSAQTKRMFVRKIIQCLCPCACLCVSVCIRVCVCVCVTGAGGGGGLYIVPGSMQEPRLVEIYITLPSVKLQTSQTPGTHTHTHTHTVYFTQREVGRVYRNVMYALQASPAPLPRPPASPPARR